MYCGNIAPRTVSGLNKLLIDLHFHKVLRLLPNNDEVLYEEVLRCWGNILTNLMQGTMLSVCHQWANTDNLFLNISFVHPLWLDRQRSVTYYEMDEPQAVPRLYCSPACRHLFLSAPKPNSSSQPVGMGGWDPAPSVQSVSQQAHKGPAAPTTGNLPWWWGGGHNVGLESIAFHFNQEIQLGIFFQPKWWINTLLFKCLIKLKTQANWMKVGWWEKF